MQAIITAWACFALFAIGVLLTLEREERVRRLWLAFDSALGTLMIVVLCLVVYGIGKWIFGGKL